MTEREYVETIRRAAESYIDGLPDPDSAIEAFENWKEQKLSISPFTVLELCDAWLTMQEAAE